MARKPKVFCLAITDLSKHFGLTLKETRSVMVDAGLLEYTNPARGVGGNLRGKSYVPTDFAWRCHPRIFRKRHGTSSGTHGGTYEWRVAYIESCLKSRGYLITPKTEESIIVENPRLKVYNKYHRDAPVGSVYIGHPSIWGNPFDLDKSLDRDESVELYGKLVETKINDDDFKTRLKEISTAKGLICFCAPKRCHGDVLIETMKRLGYLET